jgi:hypothetical protein
MRDERNTTIEREPQHELEQHSAGIAFRKTAHPTHKGGVSRMGENGSG